MKNIFHVIAAGVFHLGGFGMLLLGIVDSSFLTVPVANDLLVIAQRSDRGEHRLRVVRAPEVAGVAHDETIVRNFDGMQRRVGPVVHHHGIRKPRGHHLAEGDVCVRPA